MKIKWVELKADDPIFKSGFIISPINSHRPKKASKSIDKKKGIQEKDQNKKKGGVTPPLYNLVQRFSFRMVIP